MVVERKVWNMRSIVIGLSLEIKLFNIAFPTDDNGNAMLKSCISKLFEKEIG